MTLEELRKEVPELENYLKYMPKELEQRYWIKTYAPGVIIHQKDTSWNILESLPGVSTG